MYKNMKKHLLMLFVAVMATAMSLNAQTIIIDEGFENGISEDVWTQEFVEGNTAWAVEDISDGLSYPNTVKQGTKRAYLRNTTGVTQGYVTRLVSKVMDLSISKIYQPELSFWYANPKWTSDRDTLRVLYRTGRNARWNVLAEFSDGASNWQRVNLELPEVNATYQIAFEGKDNLGRGIVLDSIKLRSAPICTVPHDIIVNNKGANKVNIAWSASWDAYYFEMIVSKDTIDPNLVDEIPEDSLAFHGMIDGLQQNYDLTLESGQFYLVYIRSICENETSIWSSETSKDGPYGFWVRPTRQVPFTEGFNDLQGTEDPQRNLDWSWGNSTGNKNPYVNTTMGASQKAYYSLDKSPAVIFSGVSNNATKVIPAGKYVYLATPAIADTTKALFALNQCQVRFWSTVYIYTGRTYARSIIVGVMTNPDDITTFVPVDTVSVWGNKTFQENIVDLSSYNGHGAYVAFLSDFDRQNLFYIDDVTIEYKPEVNKVTRISVNPRDVYADISWEGNASSYDVLVTNAEVADPSNPDAEAVVAQATVNTNSYHCTGLEEDHSWNRPYYVYVKAAGTEWSYRYPFVTIASQRPSLPYTFDFEPSSGRYKIGTGTSYYPTGMGIFGNDPKYPALSSANVYKGSGCLFMNKTAGADTWVTLPIVDSLQLRQVKFFLSGNATYSQAHASIGVMTNPMDIDTYTKVADFKLNTTGYTMCYANFENYDGPDGIIAIVWEDVMNMSQNTINYIDELRVERLSECVPPANVRLDEEPDSVTVYWDPSSSASVWEVVISKNALTTAQKDKTFAEIKALGTVVVADTVTWDDPTTSPTFGFGGLIPQNNYYFYVRTVCGYDAAWWTELTFSTPCPSYDFPYKETFESYSANATVIGCWQLKDYMGTGFPRVYNAGGKNGKAMLLYSSGTTNRSLAVMPMVDGNLSDMLLTFETASYSETDYWGDLDCDPSVLYVGTIGDINDYSTFVPFDTVYNDDSGAFHKVRLNLADYYMAYDNIAFSSGVGSLKMSSAVYLDNVQLQDPSCQEAYNFVYDAGPDDIEFRWDGASASGQWELKVLSGTSVVLDNTVLTAQAYQLTDLTPRTNYTIYVRALCGDSTWVSLDVQTECEAIDPSIPNRETFESCTEGKAPDCWTVGTKTGAGTMPYVTSTSGNKVLYIKQSSSANLIPYWAASPIIKCDSLSTVMVTFTYSAYSGEQCTLGVMTDPKDLNSFVPLDSVFGSGQSNMKTVSFDLSEYASLIPASAKHIAWRGSYDNDDWIYLDDIVFTSVLCPSTKPTYSDLTESSVRINSGLKNNDDVWKLYITSEYVSADSLASVTYRVPDSIIVNEQIVTGRSKTVTGLEGSTKYYVATATICDTITSIWRTLSFYTPCSAIKPEALGTITFSEKEGYETGEGGYMPCWTVGSKTAGASSSYIPYVDTYNKHGEHNSLKIYDYVYGTSSNYVGAYAIMPELNVDSINKYQVSFWGRGYNSSYSIYNSQLIVGVVSDPSDLNTFVALDTVTMTQSEWAPYSVGFENYEGDFLGEMGKNIMFLSEFGMTNYAYISDISVEIIPRCRPISSFTVDSVGENAAVISWRGYQSTYRLLVSDKVLEESEKASYYYLLDSTVYHSDHVRLNGLQPATNYYIYAQGICDEGDSTSISMLYAAVRTECPTTDGVPVPFYDDFESYASGESQPGCWQLLGYSGLRVGEVSSNGTKAINLWSSGYLVVPKVNVDLVNLKLTFDARPYYSSSSAQFYVGVMEDVNDRTTFQLLETFTVPASEEFTTFEMVLGDYDLPYDNLVLTAGISTVTPTVGDEWIDNVGLSIESTCHAPKLTATASMSHAISFHITPTSPDNDLWEYVIVSDSVLAKVGNLENYLNRIADRITTDSLDVTVTDLEPATTYSVFIRTICGDPDGTSPWSKEPLKVHTTFYYYDSYFFGFEKTERWVRSQYSASDNYYIHPALTTGRDTLGLPSTTYGYYPYSLENTNTAVYAHTGKGALCMYSAGNYHGGYVIFPEIDHAAERAFGFKVRAGYLNTTKMQATSSFESVLEIGTIDKNSNFDTYEVLAYVRLDSLLSSQMGEEDNNWLYQYFTMNIDSATIADKQLVLHAPQQPSAVSYIYVDDVQLGSARKGVSLVSLNKITADGESATIEFAPFGAPWNLYITRLDEQGQIVPVAEYFDISETPFVVDDLEQRMDYTAILESAHVSDTSYVTTTHLNFRTACRAIEPNNLGEFAWDFDDPYEWEANDVLQGIPADTAYFKPACFHVGVTYNVPVDGYQWLIQSEGYNYTGALDAYSERHLETGRNNTPALRINTTEQFFNSYIVLPELNCKLDTMMIEFYGRCFANYDENYDTEASRGKIVGANYLSAMYSQSIVVGTLTDPQDFSTLQILDTLTYRQTNLTASDNVNNDTTGLRYWELMQLPLSNAKGKYIVLFQPAQGLFFLDDLAVKPIGNTLFAPTNLRTTAVADATAVLSWSVKHPNLASVVVAFNGSNEEIARDTVAGTTHTLTNLAPGASYQWFVYQTDTLHNSPASLYAQFATECIEIAPSYATSFELADGWTLIPGQNVHKQALCWTYSDAAKGAWTSASYDPINQPNNDMYRYSRTDSFAVYMKASASTSAISYQPYIAMPEMDVTAYDTLQLTFWLRPAYVNAVTGKVAATYTGNTYSKSIVVGTMTDPNDASTFVPLDTVTYDGVIAPTDYATEANNYLYQPMKVDLAGGTGRYIALMASFYEKGGETRKNNDCVWIDDIAFRRRPTCEDPTNLKAEHIAAYDATLSWDGGNAQTYRLQVSTDPYFGYDTAFVFNGLVTAVPYTVGGLETLTTYYWRVQASCGAGEESDFSKKQTFTTYRSPYFLDDFSRAVSSDWTFSTTQANKVVDTTAVITSGNNSHGFTRTQSNIGLQGSHYVAAGYSNDFHWMITPAFYLPEDSVHFSMDLALTACNSSHSATAMPATEADMNDDYFFMIIVSEDGGATWKSENILAKWQNTNPSGQQLRDISATGQTVRYSLASYAGKSLRIGLYREALTATNTGIAIHVDNVRLAYFDKEAEYMSACQYEDIQIGDIVISGDDIEPGIHSFPTVLYASDEDAKAGLRDSVYALEVEVFPTPEVSYADTICEGDTYTDVNFIGKDKSGTYRRKLQTEEHGCDSIVTLYLHVTPRTYAEDLIDTLCPGEVFTWHGRTYSRAGVFRDTLVSAAGCDSIETLVLSYHKAEDTVRVQVRVLQSELPYSYIDPQHPYVPGQAPIYYAAGTMVGKYVKSVLVQGENCAQVLIHTIFIEHSQGIDDIFGESGDGARKVIYRDQLYIILNDEWYNAEGKKVADPRR